MQNGKNGGKSGQRETNRLRRRNGAPLILHDEVSRWAEALQAGKWEEKIQPAGLGGDYLRLAESLNQAVDWLREPLHQARKQADYLDRVPTPVLAIDQNFSVVYINLAGAKAVSRSVEGCLGKKCYALFDTLHCNTPECRCRQAMDKEGICSGETVARGAGNIPIRYTAIPLRDEQGRIVGALEYVLDFTIVRQALDAAQEKVSYLNNVPTPVVAIDKNFNVIFVNEAGARAVGRTVESCVGKKCYSLFDTTHCHTPECRVKQAMERDGVFTGETVARGAGSIAIQYTAAPLRDAEGKTIGALEYIADISALKEQQKYLEHSAKRINEVMQEIAKGNLQPVELKKEKEDEIGSIMDNIQVTLAHLRDIVTRIRAAAANVASAAEEISAASNQITKGAQSQASAAEETSASMEQMAANIQGVAKNAEGLAGNVDETSSSIQQMGTVADSVAKNAESMAKNVTETSATIEQMVVTIDKTAKNVVQADQLAQQASAEAKKGGDAVLKTVEGMKSASETVANISGVIQGLSQRSEAIGGIVGVIEEIADQTNLLALNAAIEAARAGDAGRGFAVVADEVRKLAERSIKATKEIGEVIKQVQKETGAAVKATEEGAKNAKEGIGLADRAGAAILGIVEAVNSASAIMRHISQATDEQSGAAKNVIKAVEDMNRLTQAVTQSTREQAAGIRQVVKAAENMAQMTEQVKNATGEQKQGGENVVKAVENISEIAQSNLAAVEQLSRSARDMAQQSEGLQGLVQQFKLAAGAA